MSSFTCFTLCQIVVYPKFCINNLIFSLFKHSYIYVWILNILFVNNLLLLHKNLPASEGRRLLLVRRLMDTLAFGMAIAKWHWGDARAIIKAHRDYRRMRSHYTQHPSRNLLHELPECRCNIVVDHYLRGRKVF